MNSPLLQMIANPQVASLGASMRQGKAEKQALAKSKLMNKLLPIQMQEQQQKVNQTAIQNTFKNIYQSQLYYDQDPNAAKSFLFRARENAAKIGVPQSVAMLDSFMNRLETEGKSAYDPMLKVGQDLGLLDRPAGQKSAEYVGLQKEKLLRQWEDTRIKWFGEQRKYIKDRNDIDQKEKDRQLRELQLEFDKFQEERSYKFKMHQAQYGDEPEAGTYIPDMDKPNVVAPVKGSKWEHQLIKEEDDKATQKRKLNRTYNDALNFAELSITKLEKIKGQAGITTTGILGKFLGFVPGRKAFDLKANIETLKGRLGLDRLMAMKENSARGASGLGQLSEKELDLLVAYVSNLDNAQSEEQFIENANLVIESYERLIKNLKDDKEYILGNKNWDNTDKKSNTELDEVNELLNQL